MQAKGELPVGILEHIANLQPPWCSTRPQRRNGVLMALQYVPQCAPRRRIALIDRGIVPSADQKVQNRGHTKGGEHATTNPVAHTYIPSVPYSGRNQH
jgi:hypothetical protein